LAAIVSFYLKPRKRLWQPDGVDSLIEITVPKTVEVQRTKDISQEDAQQRFGYLADIVDSEGWAVRGQGVQAPSTSPMTSDAYFTAQNAPDILDESGEVGQSLENMISKSDARRHEEMMARMRQPAAPTTTVVTPTTSEPSTYQVPVQPTPTIQATPTAVPTYNPYPTFQQTVIQPPSDDASHQLPTAQPTPAPSTSEKPISADIINLATNTDLSVEAIAREANRIKEKEEDLQDGVVLSLR
jgi:hypothetical protein